MAAVIASRAGGCSGIDLALAAADWRASGVYLRARACPLAARARVDPGPPCHVRVRLPRRSPPARQELALLLQC
jgi:hypothetical protein